MIVSELMTPTAITISPDDPLGHAIDRMDAEDIRHLPVVERGKVIGVLSERDLLEATGWTRERLEERGERRPKVVRDYMRVPVESAAPDDELAEAAARLVRFGIGCLPILVEGRLEGMLSETDVLQLYVRVFRERAEDDVEISTRMSYEPYTVTVSSSLDDALALIRRERIRHLPVVHDGWFVGFVSDRDLRRAIGRGDGERPVERVMARDFVSISAGARLCEAAELMLLHRMGAVVVLREGRLEGIVTSTDVLDRCAQVDWDAAAA